MPCVAPPFDLLQFPKGFDRRCVITFRSDLVEICLNNVVQICADRSFDVARRKIMNKSNIFVLCTIILTHDRCFKTSKPSVVFAPGNLGVRLFLMP